VGVEIKTNPHNFMKKCFKCGKEKPLSEYYKHKQMADGHLGKCKDCTKYDTQKNLTEKLKDPVFFEAEQKRHRDKYHRLNYREAHKPSQENKRKYIKSHAEKFPEKIAAKSKVGKSPSGFQFHHWSYKKEHHKDVIKIKNEDHYTLHRFLSYDQPAMCYKTKQGTLLDTKEKHVAHIRVVFQLNGIEQYI